MRMGKVLVGDHRTIEGLHVLDRDLQVVLVEYVAGILMPFPEQLMPLLSSSVGRVTHINEHAAFFGKETFQ